ncbi:response regulator [Algimonas porphyrae]|uniref:Response regulatory domain-containing protein n=1 Tax=Algimonas porphyrae TaxID=1128113 RepID=A0ABQ5V3V2_9PROT|nr:response regulator [Algimonas porphyrae]GLQ20947.1 hypothetical protein GCM10007854_19020 [Algimonas porphyrae]
MAIKANRFSVLVIDDDPYETQFVERALALSSSIDGHVTAAADFADAMAHLSDRRFDLILLDNRLTRRLSALQTVPAINTIRGTMPLAVLTADTSPHYLICPESLGVDYIVDKIDLIKFMRSFAARSLIGITCNACEFEGMPSCPKNGGLAYPVPIGREAARLSLFENRTSLAL